MTTTLNKLIQESQKDFIGAFNWIIQRYSQGFEGNVTGLDKFIANAIQSGYELAIKDVEKIIGKNEEYSQSGYFKEDNGEIITNDEIQGMNILKNELRLKLQSLLKGEK